MNKDCLKEEVSEETNEANITEPISGIASAAKESVKEVNVVFGLTEKETWRRIKRDRSVSKMFLREKRNKVWSVESDCSC